MALPDWNDIPVAYRRSLRKYHTYLKSLEDDDGEPAEEVPVTRDISITVTDGTDPVQGASVVIGETTKTTGSAGGCSFNGLTEGEKTVTVTADGYVEKTATISVDSTNLTFEIELTAVETQQEEQSSP